MTPAENLLENLREDLLRAFSDIPEYGSIGFIIHFVEKQPVRIEKTGSFSIKLKRKDRR